MAVGRAEFEQKLKSRFGQRDVNCIMLAYRLSKYGLYKEKRTNGERAFEHSKRVALILIDELGVCNYSMIAAALLHDIGEDSFILNAQNIELIFGKKIRRIVEILTKEGSLPKPQRDEKYYRELRKSGKQVRTIKLADRLDNVRDMQGWSEEKRQEYIEETEIIFLPMAERVNEYLYREIKKVCKEYSN